MDRTFTGLVGVNESHFSFLNRSAIDRAVVAQEPCERWYDDYSKDAEKAELKRLRSSFRSSIYRQHYSAWFELLVHQILLRLGLSVSTHPNLHGTDKHPDFAATSGDSGILVEATVVAPDNDPFALAPFEQDAQRKLAQLKSKNFFVWNLEARGTLHRFLPTSQLIRPFQELLDKHDPDDVTRQTARRRSRRTASGGTSSLSTCRSLNCPPKPSNSMVPPPRRTREAHVAVGRRPGRR